MSENYFVIGIDYGTDSLRSLLINAQTGSKIKTNVFFTLDGKKENIVIP